MKRVALAAAAAGALLISSAAPAAGGGRVIRFLEVSNSATDVFVDADHNNRPSAGDTFIASRVLYAWAKGGGRGARIGHLKMMCTFASAGDGFCEGTFFLPGGTIVAQTYARLFRNTNRAPVIGGTGAFAGARGTFTSRGIRNTTDATGHDVALSADVIRLLP
jgi:hypothetical protein